MLDHQRWKVESFRRMVSAYRRIDPLNPSTLRDESWRRAFLVAIATSSAALVVRVLIALLAGNASSEIVPFAPFFLSSMVASLIAGTKSGLLSLAVGSIAAWILFFPPLATLGLPDMAQTLNLVLYGMVGGAIVLVSSGLRHALLCASDEEARLNRVQEAGAVGDWTWDSKTDVVVWSTHQFRLLGRDPKYFTPSTDAFRQLVHPEDLDHVDRVLKSAMASDNRFETEMRIAMPDGRYRRFISRGDIVRGRDGNVQRLLGVNIDVTQLRAAQTALDESRERQETLFAAMEEGFVIGELVRSADGAVVDHRVIDANLAFERITGLRRDAVLGKAQRAIEPGIDPIWAKFYAGVVESGRPDRIQRYVERIGRYLDLRAFPINGDRFGAIFLDVTERKTAEIERDAALARLSLAMENARMGTWDVDVGTRAVVVSESMDHMFGLDPHRTDKRVEDYTALMNPDDVAELRPRIDEASERGLQLRMEYRLNCPSGGLRWIDSRGVPMTDADGRRRLVGAVFDITERKALEVELEAARNRAELLFREMNHRTKNNLQIVSSLLSLRGSAAGNDAAGHMSAARERIATIADLHASLYQSDAIGEIDLGAYIRVLCERLETSFSGESPVRIAVDLQSVDVSADIAVPLGLVVNEIVTNAIKHAFAPGTPDRTIAVRLEKEGEEIRLAVRDNGRGLPDDWQTSVGLGSRMIRSFVKQVGGDLSVSLDGGTHFEIRLKAATKATS